MIDLAMLPPLKVAKTFGVARENVTVSGSYEPAKRMGSVMISITDPNGPGLSFSMLHDLTRPSGEHVDCRTFGTVATHCDLNPPLGSCHGCPLSIREGRNRA